MDFTKNVNVKKQRRFDRSTVIFKVKSKIFLCVYNYKLAKWLDEKLKPLSVNDQTINDIFSFADDLHEMKIVENRTF